MKPEFGPKCTSFWKSVLFLGYFGIRRKIPTCHFRRHRYFECYFSFDFGQLFQSRYPKLKKFLIPKFQAKFVQMLLVYLYKSQSSRNSRMNCSKLWRNSKLAILFMMIPKLALRSTKDILTECSASLNEQRLRYVIFLNVSTGFYLVESERSR